MNAAISETRDIAACRTLRKEVFTEEQGVSEDIEVDDLDDAAVHLLANLGEAPVGTARILITDGIAKIGRVCVLKSRRGSGIGRALIFAAIEAARARGARSAKLGSQVHALAFYETLGFAAFGPVYQEGGIDHRDMELAL